MSALALQVWQLALRARGATLWTVHARLERLGLVVEPSAVSAACRELVRAGYADKSPLGYRARQVRQLELVAGGGACDICTASCTFEAMQMCARRRDESAECGFDNDQPEALGGAFEFVPRDSAAGIRERESRAGARP